MSPPLSAHTRGRTQTHSWSAFLSAPLSSVPPNEERTNEGQLGDETVVVVVVVGGGRGSDVAEEKDDTRDKEASVRGKQAEDESRLHERKCKGPHLHMLPFHTLIKGILKEISLHPYLEGLHQFTTGSQREINNHPHSHSYLWTI